jgi:DNA repair protein RadA/Sms
MNLMADDVFINVAGGIAVDEPAADLAVSGAVASSLRNRTVRAGTAVFGEVGLAGEVRGVSQAALRVREAAQMGFTRCVIPEGNCSPDDVPAGIELVGVRTVSEALEQLIEW